MENKSVFTKFRFIKKGEYYHLKYLETSLVLFHQGNIAKFLGNNLHKKFLEMIIKSDSKPDTDTHAHNKGQQLEKVYTKLRRKFYRNKKITSFSVLDKEFKYFIKAAKIITKHNTNNNKFMQAQIEGLKFARVFPKPSQIATKGAEQRLVTYLHNAMVDATEEKDIDKQRIRLTYDDKNTPLMENPRFFAAWNKHKTGKASLRELYFINDCMMLRKEGRVADSVKKEIKLKESEKGK